MSELLLQYIYSDKKPRKVFSGVFIKHAINLIVEGAVVAVAVVAVAVFVVAAVLPAVVQPERPVRPEQPAGLQYLLRWQGLQNIPLYARSK